MHAGNHDSSKTVRKSQVPPAQALGDAVVKLRTERAMTQAELAMASNLHRNQIWKVEKGRASVGLDVICVVAAALGLSPVALFEAAGFNVAEPVNKLLVRLQRSADSE